MTGCSSQQKVDTVAIIEMCRRTQWPGADRVYVVQSLLLAMAGTALGMALAFMVNVMGTQGTRAMESAATAAD